MGGGVLRAGHADGAAGGGAVATHVAGSAGRGARIGGDEAGLAGLPGSLGAEVAGRAEGAEAAVGVAPLPARRGGLAAGGVGGAAGVGGVGQGGPREGGALDGIGQGGCVQSAGGLDHHSLPALEGGALDEGGGEAGVLQAHAQRGPQVCAVDDAALQRLGGARLQAGRQASGAAAEWLGPEGWNGSGAGAMMRWIPRRSPEQRPARKGAVDAVHAGRPAAGPPTVDSNSS